MQLFPWVIADYNNLIDNYLSKRLHHAVLLESKDTFSSVQLQKALAKRVLCQQKTGKLTPCEECHSCHLFDSGNHPDFYDIVSEKDKIGIDSIRDVMSKINDFAQQGGAKVVCIESVDRLTEAASNALLKTLEEPPKQTFFILTVKRRSSILPTLQSRCLYRQLKMPLHKDLRSWLESNLSNDGLSYSANEIDTAILLSENHPMIAYSLLHRDSWQTRQELCRIFNHAIEQKQLINLISILMGDSCIKKLDWIISLLIDAVKFKKNAANFIINRDQIALIKNIAVTCSHTSHLTKTIEQCLSTRLSLKTIPGVNEELIITQLILDLQALLF